MKATIEIQKRYKYRPWSIGWALFIIITYAAWIAYLIYGYFKGKGGNPDYLPTYNLFRHPSWQHFKDFLANLANDPLTEAGMIVLIAILPIPGLPYYVYERMEFVLAKVGIFQLFVTAVLGKPSYSSTDKSENWVESILSYVLFIAVIGIIIGSVLCTKYKWCLFS